MSTKNLARTVIEGGRRGGNVWDRRYSHREERQEARAYLHEAQRCYDSEGSDDVMHDGWPSIVYSKPIPKRRHVYKEFDDKLNPAYGWLRKHVGQRWDDVHSELRRCFDDRTTAGRHVMHDHVLKDIEPHAYTAGYRGDFYVDDDGILRLDENSYRAQRRGWTQNPPQPKAPRFTRRSLDGIRAWLRGRRVVDVGGKIYWSTPRQSKLVICERLNGTRHSCDRPVEKTTIADVPAETRDYYHGRTFDGYDKPYVKITRYYHREWFDFHADKLLNEKALRYWETLDPQIKARILEGKFV